MSRHVRTIPPIVFAGMAATAMVATIGTPAGAQWVEMRLPSQGIGKRYEVTITRGMLEHSPAWPVAEANPPVGARKAIALAEREKSTLVKDDNRWTWRLESATLMPFDHDRWYWVIGYTADFREKGGGLPPRVNLVVLMDGTVVRPKVTLEESGERKQGISPGEVPKDTPHQYQNRAKGERPGSERR